MRMTPQRRRVIAAVEELGHATPDALAATVARDGGAALPLSTIYRNLEALEDLGVVTHTHLDHRSPTYHLAEHADHLHLVCLRLRDGHRERDRRRRRLRRESSGPPRLCR